MKWLSWNMYGDYICLVTVISESGKWFHVVSNSMHILTHSECFSASRIISRT